MKGASMTENEAIKQLQVGYLGDTEDLVQAKHIAIKALEEIKQYRAIGTVEQLEWCKDASHWKELFKDKLEQYEAIGTVEEFKALKEKKNILPIATIKISKEDMQKIVDEKVAQIELDIQGIRAKTIDEFKDSIKTELDRFGVVNLDTCVLYDFMDRKAERLKAGADNE